MIQEKENLISIHIRTRFSKSSKYQHVVSCSVGLEHTNVECPAKNHEIFWINNGEENQKIQIEEMKNYSKSGGYFHINISNSLELLEKYRVSVDTQVMVHIFRKSLHCLHFKALMLVSIFDSRIYVKRP